MQIFLFYSLSRIQTEKIMNEKKKHNRIKELLQLWRYSGEYGRFGLRVIDWHTFAHRIAYVIPFSTNLLFQNATKFGHKFGFYCRNSIFLARSSLSSAHSPSNANAMCIL